MTTEESLSDLVAEFLSSLPERGRERDALFGRGHEPLDPGPMPIFLRRRRSMYETIQDFFKVGMSRTIPELRRPPESGLHINLGAGKKKVVPGDPLPVDRPEWRAGQSLEFNRGSVSVVHAYHFLEHLTGAEIVHVLGECQRVMMPGAVMNVVVPYYSSQLMALSVDHKTAFCEDTLRSLFTDDYWDYPGVPQEGWQFDVGLCVIIGIVERNLALLVQLIRR